MAETPQGQKGRQWWRIWHASLINLVNGALQPRSLRLLCELYPRQAYSCAARAFVNRHAHTIACRWENEEDATQVVLDLAPCPEGPLPVTRMRDWLDRHLSGELFAAILHGSLATGEIVNYSDFDALVIIRNEVLTDAGRLSRVAKQLFEARRFMYEQDPLQHHGWFVLPEAALSSWPEDYLPMAVLREARHLMTANTPILRFNPVIDRSRQRKAFFSVARSVLDELTQWRFLNNLYRFKSFLSKVMLLPALYVQARDGVGVFKRDSFDLARHDFSEEDWAVMDTISAVRRDWPRVQLTLPRFFFLRPGLLGEQWRRSYFNSIPVNLSQMIGRKELLAIFRLVKLMQNKLIVN